jgi:hypothetical protein
MRRSAYEAAGGMAGSNPADGIAVTLLCSLSCEGSGLCDELFSCSEESYRLCVCVCVCVCVLASNLDNAVAYNPDQLLHHNENKLLTFPHTVTKIQSVLFNSRV